MARHRQITPVLLCGGSGTRLWPLSRAGQPKQLLPLASAETMLQMTLRRTQGPGFATPVIVTGAELEDAVSRQLVEVGAGQALMVLEACARNTAPAAALAALGGDDSLLLIMPSDHLITDVTAFLAAVERAAPWAEQGWLVTFGIPPQRAETGYGYLKRRESLAPGVYAVDCYVEKPDAARAEAFLRQGGHDWNAGIFLFRADTYVAALASHAPEVLHAARTALAEGKSEGRTIRPDPAAFASSPSTSIDHAVMERADRIAVVPVEMGWSDIGSWAALHEVSEKDGDGNVVAGDVLAIDTKGCLIRTAGPTVVTIGVDDLVVIASADAVLVVRRDQSQRVGQAAERLADKNHGTI